MGTGWAPTVLNSQAELDFIRQGQIGTPDRYLFWIGGSTNASHTAVLDIDSYIAGETGN